MAHEINLGGTIYISSSRAAQKHGYSQDYIGQLLRSGKIHGKKIGGMWYVLEESLDNHKINSDAYVPSPPSRANGLNSANIPEALISFDGQSYVSAAEASKITGYSQDYVGQLARQGAILSRLVGKRWYVDSKALKAHKAEKDALLYRVQAQSVGLPDRSVEQDNRAEVSLHYAYYNDERELLPSLRPAEYGEEGERDSEMNIIPIRVIRTMPSPINANAVTELHDSAPYTVRKPSLSMFYGLFTATVATIVLVVAYNINLVQLVPEYGATQSSVVRSTALAGAAENSVQYAANTIRDIFSNEVRYQRTENWTN